VDAPCQRLCSGRWAFREFSGGIVSSVPQSISQSVATTPGETYPISFFAGSILPLQPINLAVTFGGTVFSHLFSVGQTGYNEFTFNATASGANTNLSLTVQGNVPYTFFFDDISVGPAGVGVPDGGTTASLLGCALVGLAGLRRKLDCSSFTIQG